jgi:hypothetical protein
MDLYSIIPKAIQSAFTLYGLVIIVTSIWVPKFFLHTISVEAIEHIYWDANKYAWDKYYNSDWEGKIIEPWEDVEIQKRGRRILPPFLKIGLKMVAVGMLLFFSSSGFTALLSDKCALLVQISVATNGGFFFYAALEQAAVDRVKSAWLGSQPAPMP